MPLITVPETFVRVQYNGSMAFVKLTTMFEGKIIREFVLTNDGKCMPSKDPSQITDAELDECTLPAEFIALPWDLIAPQKIGG